MNLTNELKKIAGSLGGIGKTFTGSSNLMNITAGQGPGTPNLNYNITQFKPSLPGLNPALAGLPNLPTFSRPNLQNMLIEGQNINYGEKVTDWASNQLGFDAGIDLKNQLGLDADFGRNYLQDIQEWGGNQLGLDANTPNYGKKITDWATNQLGLDAGFGKNYGAEFSNFLYDLVGGYRTPEDDKNKKDDGNGDTDTTTTAAPDTSEEADALMSGSAKPGEMSERDRLARIRRMLAGRYGRAETQLTKGGFGEGTGRSLTGYA